MSQKTFYHKLVEVLSDSEVQKNLECLEMLLDAKERLESGEPESLVASRISESISLYLMAHTYKAPEKVLELSKIITSAPAKHRGMISIPFWVSSLFRH